MSLFDACTMRGHLWARRLDATEYCMRCAVRNPRPEPVDTGEEAVQHNWEAWCADIWSAVQDEAASTGLLAVEIVCAHHMRLSMAGAPMSVLLVWAELVSYLTGHLPPGPAKRRWAKVAK